MDSTGVSILVMVIVIFAAQTECSDNGTFTIDYDNNTFVMNGKPFRYVSGSIHYFRIPQLYWKDRLTKMYASGLSAVQVYIAWNYHQPERDQFNFEGDRDFVQFLNLAHEIGLFVILRPGPFICAEWDFGGIPAWILKEKPDVALRSMDSIYIKYVEIWLNKIYPMIQPLLFINGGPIITVQIENEYGSYIACDHSYTAHLRDLARSHFGQDVVLFTVDNDNDLFLKCGTVPGVYATIDFGISKNPMEKFKHQRKFAPKGPLVNTEFYTGWIDYWGQQHSVRDASQIASNLDTMLQNGVNVNMYMFEGGTNFGYWNGANYFVYPLFWPVPTSYDYDAPLDEAGDTTDKYYTLRKVISKYNTIPQIKIPENSPKGKYPTVQIKFVATIQDYLPIMCPSGAVQSRYPVSMESIGAYQGFALYRHILDRNVAGILRVDGVRDRGYIMLDQVPIGVLKRDSKVSYLMRGHKGQTLDILVENQGHINVGPLMNKNLKGIIENVTMDGRIMENWSIYAILPDNIKQNDPPPINNTQPKFSNGLLTPSIYMGVLNTSDPMDTYLDLTGWTKGQAVIQDGLNLGRYWPTEGPQARLYVPKPAITHPSNVSTLILMELEFAPCGTSSGTCVVNFVDHPFINKTTVNNELFP